MYAENVSQRCVPSILFFSNSPQALPYYAYAGFFVWMLGLTIEAVSDKQKYSFINNPENKGKWVNVGLWKYSRHPNYFGEILLWIGVYLFTLSGLTFYQAALGLLGPMYIAALIIFVSGIPLLEKSAEKKWGTDTRYQEYKKNTSILIPLMSSGKI